MKTASSKLTLPSQEPLIDAANPPPSREREAQLQRIQSQLQLAAKRSALVGFRNCNHPANASHTTPELTQHKLDALEADILATLAQAEKGQLQAALHHWLSELSTTPSLALLIANVCD